MSAFMAVENVWKDPRFFLRKNRGSANHKIERDETPSIGATASQMATDILHSLYMMLKLFFLMMIITRSYHNDFTLRSFFTSFPGSRSCFSEENFKNERFQRSDSTGRTVSTQMRIDSSTDILLQMGKSTLA